MCCNNNRNRNFQRDFSRKHGECCGREMALAKNHLIIDTTVEAGECITTSPIKVNIPVDVRYFLRSTTADCELTGTCEECECERCEG